MLRRFSPRWLILLTVVVFLLPACTNSAGDVAATTAPASTAPATTTSTVSTTVPATTTSISDETTTTTVSTLPTSSPEGPGTPQASVVTGFTSFTNTNTILDLAVEDDGSVWAATTGGVVHWNLGSGRPEIFRSEDGLASNMVESVAIGPSGVVWFGTDSGVSTFDGATWATRLNDRAVFDVLVASDGSVWLGTNRGVTVMARDVETHYTMADGLLSSAIVSLAEISDGEIYASAMAFEEDPGSPGVMQLVNGVWVDVSDRSVTNVKLVVASDDTLWAFDRHTLAAFDGDQWILHEPASAWPDPGGAMLSATAGSEGVLWFGTEAGVKRYDSTNWESLPLTSDLDESHVWSIAVADDGAVVAGTYHGLGLYKDGEWAWHRTVNPFPGSRVNAIELALDGALWIGTDRGIARWDGAEWTSWTETLIDGAFVESIAIATDGTVWAGNSNSISWFDGESWHPEGGTADAPPHEGSGLYGEPLAAAPDGGVWATRRGGGPIKHQAGEWTSASDTPSECRGASDLAVTSDGSLWVGNRFSGLCQFDGTTWQLYGRGLEGDDWDPWGRDAVWAVEAAPDIAVWVGTDRTGIGRLDAGVWEEYTNDVFAEDAVTALAFAHDTIWAGTLRSGVLYSTDRRDWTRLTASDGLAGNRVWAIVVDTAGSAWVGTNAGLSRYVSTTS